MIRVETLKGWTQRLEAGAQRWESPVWPVSFEWIEAVPSWNVAAGSGWIIELRATGAGQFEDWYPLGSWCSDTNRAARTSWTGGSFAGGSVLTDTLRLNQPATGLQARLTLGAGTTTNDFHQLAVSLLDTRATWAEPESCRAAWGRELAVPLRSQADFPEGVSAWCSPTSVTMLLAWWSAQRGLPHEPVTVPEAAGGVFDPGWPGTGNWAFNVAYAGQTPGLRTAVARLAGLGDLERWLALDLPVATSVSYALLKERPEAETGDGHLVVVRGFTVTGDVIVNDPGVRLSRGQRVVPRAAFRRAWQHSSNTAYLVWPAAAKLPEGGDGRW